MSPFGYNNEYVDWNDCIAKNSDKRTPEKYCGWIKHQTEDIIPHNCIMKAYIHYKEKYPKLTERDWLKKSFDYFKNKKINNTTEDFSHDYLYNFNPAEIRLILQGLESLYLNEEEDPFFAETIRNIADQINASSTGLFEENEESAIYLLNLIKERYGESKTKTGHGWWGETERHSRARKTGHADTINPIQENYDHNLIMKTYQMFKMKYPEYSERELLREVFSRISKDFTNESIDSEYIGNIYDLIEDQIGTKITGPEKTRLQEQFERLKTLETLRKQNIIPAPYQMVNTETGAVLTGQVLYNLDKNTKQLTPVSSTNVKAIGQFNNQLLAQFHAKGAGGFTHTYRYEFESPEQAEEAYNSIMNSGSPGRWVWHNLRGHAKGEPTGIQNVPEKYGPAITNPNLKVIGGTSASLVDYNISNRTPVSRMINFEKINKQLKRRRANIATDPSTGSRVEGILGARKGLRNLRISGWRAGQHGLPKRDFDGIGDFIGNVYDLIEDYNVKGHYRTTKSGKRIWIRRHTRGEGTSIKDKPRMRPLYEWEIRENYQRQLAKLFGKEKYSKEIEMEGKQDYFGKDFHETISIADNVNYKRIDLSIGLANNALRKLPKSFQLDFLDITFYSKITDDPNFESNPKDVPAPYRKVGWNSTYEDVSAQISYKHAKIRIKTSGQDYGHASSMRHEMGHAVWWWVIRGSDKQRFNEIYENKKWELKRQGETGEYQANDINEFFAVQFENYYSGFYGAMFPETKSYFDYINKKYGGENKI